MNWQEVLKQNGYEKSYFNDDFAKTIQGVKIVVGVQEKEGLFVIVWSQRPNTEIAYSQSYSIPVSEFKSWLAKAEQNAVNMIGV